MLDRLEFLHSKNLFHRDIKSDNFVLGLDNKNHIIYVLDFGLSKRFLYTGIINYFYFYFVYNNIPYHFLFLN